MTNLPMPSTNVEIDESTVPIRWPVAYIQNQKRLK